MTFVSFSPFFRGRKVYNNMPISMQHGITYKEAVEVILKNKNMEIDWAKKTM